MRPWGRPSLQLNARGGLVEGLELLEVVDVVLVGADDREDDVELSGDIEARQEEPGKLTPQNVQKNEKKVQRPSGRQSLTEKKTYPVP